MMKVAGRKQVLAVLLALAGCALPVPENVARQQFVAGEEIRVVEAMRLGTLLYNQSRLVEAEEQFRAAYRLAPTAIPVRLSLAAVLERQGIFEEARSHLRFVTTNYPENIDAVFSLAKLEYEARNYTAAREAFDRGFFLAAKFGDRERAWLIAKSRSSMEFSLGGEESALCFSAQALEFRSDAIEIVRHARLLRAAGRLHAAYAYLTQQSDANGLNTDASVLLERAIVAFGLEEKRVAKELHAKYLLASISNPVVSAESVMLGEALLTERERSLLSDKEATERAEQLENALAALQGGQSGATLFWPVNLLQTAQELARLSSVDGQES